MFDQSLLDRLSDPLSVRSGRLYPHPTPDSVSPTVSPPGSGGPSYSYIAVRDDAPPFGGKLVAIIRHTETITVLDTDRRLAISEMAKRRFEAQAYGTSDKSGEELWIFARRFGYPRFDLDGDTLTEVAP